MTYCVDDDLTKYRADILSLGVPDFQDQREEAFAIINRAIIARWYNKAATRMGVDFTITLFDPTKVKEGELKRLECFKTLELANILLAKNGKDPDGFERFRVIFKKEYGDELNILLGTGISYDWSGDGTIDPEERKIQAPRRLSRC